MTQKQLTCFFVKVRSKSLIHRVRYSLIDFSGVSRMGVDTMMAELEKLVPLGLKSVLLFSVTDMQKVRHKVDR